jgi:hypothetical protein
MTWQQVRTIVFLLMLSVVAHYAFKAALWLIS